MKKKIGILLTLSAVLVAGLAYAFPSAQSARVKFSSNAILTTNYTQLVSSLTRPVGSITVMSTAVVPLQIATGASGSEVVQLVIPAYNGVISSQVAAPVPVSYPIQIPAGSRVAVIALDNSTGSTGQSGLGDLEVNFLFN